MKISMWLVVMGFGMASARVYAAKACVLLIPQDCEVLSSNYSALSTDGTHVVQVDCRKPNGEMAKYLTSRFALSSLWGMGRDYLPRKITFATWPKDEIGIRCQ